MGGDFTSVDGGAAGRLVRMNADGVRDTSFNVAAGFSGGPVYSLTEQFDGRLIVHGGFTSYRAITNTPYIVRLWPEGSYDSSFHSPNGGNTILATALAPDGQILICGLFGTQYDGHSAMVLALLHGDGPPRITTAKAGNSFTCAWPDVATVFSMQQSFSASGPWANAPAAVNHVGRSFVITNSPATDTRFFRLAAP